MLHRGSKTTTQEVTMLEKWIVFSDALSRRCRSYKNINIANLRLAYTDLHSTMT